MGTWRVRKIDAGTWLPAHEVGGVDGVSISRKVGKDAKMLESAMMDVTGTLGEGYYRVELLDDVASLVDVATMLFAPDGFEWNHRKWSGSMSGRSVLAPASERRLSPGAYAPKGVDGAQWCVDMLSGVIDAPVTREGSFSLAQHVVFDLGDSHLDAVWAVLDAAGWCMQISGDGTVTVREMPSEPSLVIDSSDAAILMPNLSRSMPIEDVPNVLRVYDGATEHVAENDDPASPTSIPARGRRIEKVEEDPTLREGETYGQYARRRLAELGDICEEMDIEREHVDGIVPYDVIRANLPEPGVVGDYRVMSQTVRCGNGITVGETWGRIANGRN